MRKKYKRQSVTVKDLHQIPRPWMSDPRKLPADEYNVAFCNKDAVELIASKMWFMKVSLFKIKQYVSSIPEPLEPVIYLCKP